MCIQSALYFILLRKSALPSHTPLVVEFTNWHANITSKACMLSVFYSPLKTSKSMKYKHVTLKWLWVALHFKYIIQVLTILCTCQYCIKDSCYMIAFPYTRTLLLSFKYCSSGKIIHNELLLKLQYFIQMRLK